MCAQDWNYIAGDCLELTLELAPHKWPPAEQLPGLFEDNLPALLALPLAACFGGVRCGLSSKFQNMNPAPEPCRKEVPLTFSDGA